MLSPKDNSPLINAEADRILGRILLRYSALTFLFLILDTVFVIWANARLRPTKLHDFFTLKLILLNGISILIVLIPFFAGINRLFAARLQIGRDLVERRVWREAIPALEPFASPMQRFLDRSGEAHALLARAYEGAGDKTRAEAARAFIRHHRPQWAGKLPPSPSEKRAAGQENRPRPAKGRPRRRF